MDFDYKLNGDKVSKCESENSNLFKWASCLNFTVFIDKGEDLDTCQKYYVSGEDPEKVRDMIISDFSQMGRDSGKTEDEIEAMKAFYMSAEWIQVYNN